MPNILKSHGKKQISIFVSIIIFLFVLIPIYAAITSSQFLPKAQEFINNNCQKKHPGDEASLLCYLFYKTNELTTNQASIQSTITDLKGRVSVLENEVATLQSFSPTPGTCLPHPSGIVSWWTGDNTANDVEGLNNGTINTGVSYVSGEVGQAFNFNGADGFMQTPTNSLPTGNADRTLSLWVKINSFQADVPDPSSPQESFFAGYGNFGSGGQTYQLGTAGNILYFSQFGSAIFGPSLQINKWYQVAVTNTGDAETLYLNGTSTASGTLTLNTPSGSTFYAGRIPGTLGDIRKLNGSIDEVQVFNRALTSSEIKSIYTAGTSGECK